MKATERLLSIVVTMSLVVCAGGVAQGDWEVGDVYKMHFPQLPDHDGWDVEGLAGGDLADDWLCTSTGPVQDIHVWFSEETDQPPDVDVVAVTILSNDPNYHGLGYSAPNELLWYGRTVDQDFSIATRLVGTGAQGWFEAEAQAYLPPPHHYNIYQLNITDIRDPFIQQAGTTYWLQLDIAGFQKYFGWKTADMDSYPEGHTGSPFMNVAAYKDENSDWNELNDPISGESLDLAFVITPEPATLALLLLGGLALLRRTRST